VLAIVAGLAAFSAGEGAKPPASVYGLPLVVVRPVEAAIGAGAQARPAGNVEEEWPRLTTRSVSGRLISVFEQTYPPDVLSDVLVYPHGNGFPQVPLGRLEDLGGGGSASTVWLKVAPSNLPASTVRSIAPPEGGETTAQYASRVVNLVLPGFDDARVGATEGGYALAEAAQAFY
jgi:hypothetical protein